MSADHEEFWEELYEVDTEDFWINGAYDEQGERVPCDWCNEDLMWNPDTRKWYCKNCGKIVNRTEWFNYIGACNVPGHKCLSQCKENYPLCKNWCSVYKIPEDDPIL